MTAAPEPRKWRTIVADPPWAYRQSWHPGNDHRAYHGPKRGAVANYSVMTIDAIAALPIGDYAEPENAHMYIWTTNTFMVEAHRLMEAWGFKQKTILTWIKPRLGMGTYYRNCTEHVLFGTRPKSPVLRKDQRTYFTGEQGRHSEKPSSLYDMVETMSPGPYLDVFARKQRFGWDVAGNEVYSAIPELAANGEVVSVLDESVRWTLPPEEAKG